MSKNIIKIIFVATFLVSVLMLTSCVYELYWDGDSIDIRSKVNLCPEINKAEIVQVGKYIYNENNEPIAFEETFVVSIENLDDFLDDFDRMDCLSSTYPQYIQENTIVIKFYCTHGNIRYISPDGMVEYHADDGRIFECGFDYFNEDEFNALIEKYISK